MSVFSDMLDVLEVITINTYHINVSKQKIDLLLDLLSLSSK